MRDRKGTRGAPARRVSGHAATQGTVMTWVCFHPDAWRNQMTQRTEPILVHFTMSLAEAHQHTKNLELVAKSADPAGREALKALLLVLRRETEKAESAENASA